ncbi:MAG TPA: hypothetical protein VM938_11525 [Acidimicrobiales bacterium]|nr:hypothetical protein [Acidimicrobiales bacterium]
MRAHRALLGLPALTAAAVLGLTAVPAAADHTESNEPLAVLSPALPSTPIQQVGQWEFLKNFPPNPGTDLKFFSRGEAIYGIAGSLGQGNGQYAGQRVVRLTGADGAVAPEWVADHGSAHCNPSRGVTGLQHDTVVTPPDDAELAVDTTDANDRCHDPGAGGMEILDISGVGREGGAPVKEVHLLRFDGTSHTATLDATRPWIVYNSNSDQDRPWIDVVDIRSCLGLTGSLEAKRAACRPAVYRMPFDPSWTTNDKGTAPHGCHDITARPGRLYCAGINGTAIIDVSGLTAGNGDVRGTPLSCTVVDGTNTAAKVSDCRVTAAQWAAAGKPAATGFSHVGHVNHPGRDATNGNTAVPSNEGVSISHEADPTPDGKWLLVTDERGGGVVPPGSTCAPTVANPVGNGGMHVFDISDPANPTYAQTNDGKKAVFISKNLLPAPTFCNIHVIEHIPDEQRIIAAWYSQGFKVIDYEIDAEGRWSFTEVGALTLPGAQTWTIEPFKIADNDDGTRTYFLMSSDIGRGIDVVSFTAEPNWMPTGRAGGPNDNANANARTRVAGAEQERSVGSLAATGEDTPMELGAVLLLSAVGVRLATTRRRRSVPST